MPHIIIKTIKGPSKEQLKKAAEEISEIVNRTMGKPKKYISVAVEEYSFDEWESVYNDCIKNNNDVILKPNYSNPKTFE